MSFNFKKLLFFFPFLIILVFSTTTVRAQETPTASSEAKVAATPPPAAIQPIDLTVSPVTLNLATDPGKEVTSAIKVFNNSTEKEYLEIKLAKFTADRTGSRPQIRDFEASDSYQEWLQFERTTFEVNPGEWETIDLTFSPPVESALAYYYAIIVKRQVDTTDDAATTIVTGAPAILVLANIYSPNAIQELQLVDFSMKKKFYEYLPAEFEIDIKNTGNIHVSPLGNIFIDKGDDKDIGLLSINKENGLILPDSERTYTAKWTEGFPAYEPVLENGVEKKNENGETVYKLNWDFSKINQFRFGKYTANLLLVYDNGTRDIPIESVLTFWVFPWKILLVLLLVTVVLSLGIISPVVMVWRKVTKKEK